MIQNTHDDKQLHRGQEVWFLPTLQGTQILQGTIAFDGLDRIKSYRDSHPEKFPPAVDPSDKSVHIYTTQLPGRDTTSWHIPYERVFSEREDAKAFSRSSVLSEINRLTARVRELRDVLEEIG